MVWQKQGIILRNLYGMVGEHGDGWNKMTLGQTRDGDVVYTLTSHGEASLKHFGKNQGMVMVQKQIDIIKYWCYA